MENPPEINETENKPDNPYPPYSAFEFRKPEPKKILLGVCAKIARRVSFNVIFIRIVFVILTLVGGWGIAAYLLLAFLLPDQERDKLTSDEKMVNFYLITGISAISAGVYFIIEPTGLFDFMSFLGFRATFFIPLLIILALFFSYYEYASGRTELPEDLRLSVTDKRIKGVCAGFARYLGARPVIIRILTIFFVFLTGGLGLPVYFYFALTLEKESIIPDEN